MNDDPKDLDAAIREIFVAEEGEVSRHPSSEALAAYVDGKLGEAASEELLEHLGPCRSCTATVLALRRNHTEVRVSDQLSDAEVVAEVEAIVSQTRQKTSHRANELWLPSRRVLAAVAATLAVVCLTLAWMAARARSDIEHLEAALLTVRSVSTAEPIPIAEIGRPQANVPIVDLYPSSVARGASSEEAKILLPGDAGMVALILTPPTGPPHQAYALRILDATEVELWHGPVRANVAGAFVVVLPRSFLLEDPTRIDLYGISDSQEELVEAYPLRFSGG